MANVRVPLTIKNVTIGDPDQPGGAFVYNSQGYTTISGGMTTASGLRLAVTSPTATGSWTLNDGDEVTILTTLSGSQPDAKCFGVIHTAAFEGSVTEANQIPIGSSIAHGDYEFADFSDWVRFLYSNYNQMKQITFVHNATGAQQTILFRARAMYIAEPSVA